MKALGCTECGGPEVLHFVEVPLPSLRPRDLLVRVKAFAVNPADAKRRRNGLAGLPLPQVLGFDGAGIVERLGTAAMLFRTGDEVYFAGDATRPGCYAEFVAIDERIVTHKPKTLNFASAAAIPLTALTAWEAFFENMRLDGRTARLERTLLIVGGAGGVGSIATQIAKRVAGLDVIATAGNPVSADFCRQMGANHVINHYQDLGVQLKGLGLHGVDYILSCVALTNFPELVSILNPLGIICCIVGREGTKSLDVTELFAKRGTLTFGYMFTRSRLNVEPERQGKILEDVAALLDRQVLVTTMTQCLDWSDIEQAHQALDSGHTLGKIVLQVSE